MSAGVEVFSAISAYLCDLCVKYSSRLQLRRDHRDTQRAQRDAETAEKIQPYLIPFFASCSRNAAETATSNPFCAPPVRFFRSEAMYSVRCWESSMICLRISLRSASRFSI